MSGAAAAGAAAAAAVARAIKASGAIIDMAPREFEKLLTRNPDGLVVYAAGGFLWKGHRYLTSYRGLIFHTLSDKEIPVPSTCEIVHSRRIWIPG